MTATELDQVARRFGEAAAAWTAEVWSIQRVSGKRQSQLAGRVWVEFAAATAALQQALQQSGGEATYRDRVYRLNSAGRIETIWRWPDEPIEGPSS